MEGIETSSIQQYSAERISRDFKPSENIQNHYNNKIGIYGWRKRCIYALILSLLIMVILNLALSLWILKVMEFSVGGLGYLRVLSEGLSLNGDAFIMDRLTTSHIKSKCSRPIILKSNKTYNFSIRNQGGYVENLILMGNNNFDCLAKVFKVKSPNKKLLFSTNGKHVFINSECLRIAGDDGSIFEGSVETPTVTAESDAELRLESPTRTLQMTAGKGLHVESRSGSSEIVSGRDIHLKSAKGSINLEAEDIRMPRLPVSEGHLYSPTHGFEIFQLCVCANGKLFLVPPETKCATRYVNTVCQ